MYVSIISEAFCALLSITLVYGCYAFPGIGPLGSIVAVVIYHLIGSLLFFLASKSLNVFFSWLYSFNHKILIEIYRISLPSCFSMFVDYIGISLLFYMMARYLDTVDLAAGRIAFSLTLFLFSFICAFSSGYFIYGARALGRMAYREYLNYSKANLVLNVFMVLFICVPVCIFPKVFLTFITKFEDIQLSLQNLLIYVFISSLLTAIWYTFSLGLRIREKTKQEMGVNLFSLWLVQIPLAYIFGVYLDAGIVGFFQALILSDIACCLLNFSLTKRYSTQETASLSYFNELKTNP